MTIRSLLDTTGNLLADRIVQGMIAIFEQRFPNQIWSWYVEGSYADQSAIITSDLDLVLVLHVPLATVHEQELADNLIIACQHMSALELDVTLITLEQLQQFADPMFKLGARLVYGPEVRDAIPLMPMTLWARQRMHAAFWLMIHVFERPQPVQAPLTFPDSNDSFYGYAARLMNLPDGTTVVTTRNVVRVTGWIATARVAYEEHQYVVRKRACVATYRERIGDHWTTLLQAIDQRCRQTWQYRIPDRPEEQAELRALCLQVLGFENHFLQGYHQFLLNELANGDAGAQASALTMLKRTSYPHPEILDMVGHLTTSDDIVIRTTACDILKSR